MSILTAARAPAAPALTRCQQCAARLHCPIGQLPLAQQDHLAPWITEKAVRKGDLVQTEGAALAAVHIVKLGMVVLTRKGPDGVARSVGIGGRGHLLGPWRLLDQPSLVGAHALSAGRICELPVHAVGAPWVQEPAFQQVLHNSLAQGYAGLADWGQVMRLRGLQRQLMAALLLLGQAQGAVAVRLPSHMSLAALLNTSRESVARTLRQLETQGLLHRIDRWHAAPSDRHAAVFDNGPALDQRQRMATPQLGAP